MLKAYSPKRFAGRTYVVRQTVFSFDKHGHASVIDQGNTRLDWESLLQLSGVYASKEAFEAITAQKAPVVAAPAPEVVPPPPLPSEDMGITIEASRSVTQEDPTPVSNPAPATTPRRRAAKMK